MSNLTDFFGGGGDSIPLRGLIAMPYDTPPKYTINGMTLLRSGVPEMVDFDPSLQSWVDGNLMFVNTYATWDDSSGSQPMTGSDTDGAGNWMVAGWRQSAYSTLLFSNDDAVSWTPVTVPWASSSTIHEIKSGLNGVWLVATRAQSGAYEIYRTTNNGASWVLVSNAVSGFNTYYGGMVTDRNGVWMVWANPSAQVAHICRSLDNGATWANISVGVASSGVRLIEYGGGEWALGYGGNPGASEAFTGTVFSNNNGNNWSVRTVTGYAIVDFAYCDQQWHAVAPFTIFVLSPTAPRWVPKPIRGFDWLNQLGDGYNGGQSPFIRAGLDDSMIIGISSNWLGRSNDGGDTFVRFNIPVTSITIAPNGRAVGKVSGLSKGISSGIVTGVKAAGIPYLPAEHVPYNNYNWNNTYNGMAIMYVRIK